MSVVASDRMSQAESRTDLAQEMDLPVRENRAGSALAGTKADVDGERASLELWRRPPGWKLSLVQLQLVLQFELLQEPEDGVGSRGMKEV